MLLTAAAACSSRRLLPSLRTEGGGAGVAKFWALTTPLQRSSSSTLRSACSPTPSPSPSPGDKDTARGLFDEFSVLSPDIPWEVEDVWRTFGAYFFTLHIPLSFGGLGVVAKVLNYPSLGPLMIVASTVMLQLGELSLALALLQYTAKPHHDIRTFFTRKFSSKRSWVKETVLGFGLLMTVVFLTSFIADKLAAYDPMLKEILSDSPTSRILCFFLYCVIAPLSEETIYRGFLLTALSSSMKSRNAVIISSLMFSVAHFSVKSFFQLFVVGCVTGLAYCRTGTLTASFTIHCLYNAVILFTTLLS